MKIDFNSSLFTEYKVLKKHLENDSQILKLVKKRNELLKNISEVDHYSSKYNELKKEYDEVSKQLSSNKSYNEFKVLERELNLFVMYCNKELEKLFDLEGKGCHK